MPKIYIAKEIESKFGNHFRIRVNGILIQDQKILLIKHQMGNGKILWSVPGGGIEFGQNVKFNLKREFEEETGLQVEVQDYLFVHEYLQPPLHALEHFFSVKFMSGVLKLGRDPELRSEVQILSEIRWMDIKDIHSLSQNSLHQIFWGINSLKDLGLYRGYFNFENNSIK
jgi:ADP-ribose pyrophosphatase YjhB (NUDIX family)